MKKILFIATIIFLSGCRPAIETQSSNSAFSLNPQLCLEKSTGAVDKLPLRDTEEGLIGQFFMEGKITQIEQPKPFSDATMEVVYLVTPDDGSFPVQAYKEIAENSGTIDLVKEDSLYLKLGILEAGVFRSSAVVDTATQESILAALESGKAIRLNMLQQIDYGKGASADSVNPCLITVE